MSDYLDGAFSLAGKTILVTGGGKGIGAMMTESLLKAGARVYIASRSEEDCQKAVEAFSQYGECKAFPHDLSVVEEIEKLAEEIKAEGNGLHAVINNSGATWGAPIEKFPEAAFDKVLGLNVKSPFFVLQKLLPLLEESASAEDPARVINIGSIAGIGAETLSAYSYQASKAAIHHMTTGLARDLARRNINVNAIAPGMFVSKMTAHIVKNDELHDQVLKTIPLGRMGGADEIGGLAIYLCSKLSAYMTGNIIPIDGGMRLGVVD